MPKGVIDYQPVTTHLKNKKMKQILKLEINGYTTEQIANEIGLSYSRVAAYKCDPEYREALKETLEVSLINAQNNLKKNVNLAVDRLIELSQSESERIALAACNSILDRLLGKAKETVELSANVNTRPLENISDESLKKLIESE